MKNINQIRAVLIKKFDVRYVDALLKHFTAAIEKYAGKDNDGVALKAGKFVEATTKALMHHCGKTITSSRHFKAGNELKQLESLNSSAYSDTIRIVIPKACIFIYEIVNNRGGRHDAHDIDANDLDAKVVIGNISWILAEMVRFCSTAVDSEAVMNFIDELTNKTYPYFEEIGDRSYINIDGLKPGEIALLLLYFSYPKRMNRQILVDLVRRHGGTLSAANTAVYRLGRLVDNDSDGWKLRGIGRRNAEELLKRVTKIQQ